VKNVTPDSSKHTLTLPWVKQATASFVHADEMREAFSLAITAGLNMIFSGPGGHGKSEFLMSAIGAISDTTPYVKSFGQGTSTEELYGGLDFDALNRATGATIQFNPELSFLPCEIAVFEELFDAPARVLTSLKDTLTARELRNGHQRHPMTTKVIAAATNHSPQEIAEGGPEIAALIERFPIQLEVKWSTYTEEDFALLFANVIDTDWGEPETVTWQQVADLQQRARNVTISPLMQRFLARIVVELRHDKVMLSPRTAILATQLVKAAAAINGRTEVIPHDATAMVFLPGAHKSEELLARVIDEFAVELVAEQELEKLESEMEQLNMLALPSESPEDNEEILNMLADFHEKARKQRVTPRLSNRLRRLKDDITHTMEFYREKNRRIELDKSCAAQREKLEKICDEARRLRDSLSYVNYTARENVARRLRALSQEVGGMYYGNIHPDLTELYEETVKLVNASTYSWRN
jgi:MoxR-like ATPase